MVDKVVVSLSEYRGRSGDDLKTLLNVHDEITKFKNPALKEFFERAWHEGATTIASSIFPVP
jgi:hypothetical protein